MAEMDDEPQLLFVVGPEADDVLVDSMASQLIENGIHFTFDVRQRLPDRLPDDLDRYRAILLDARVWREVRNNPELTRLLEAYASAAGYVFSFVAEAGAKGDWIGPSSHTALLRSRTANVGHAADLAVMIGSSGLRRMHPGFVKRQRERSDDRIVEELKASLIENLARLSGWGEYTKMFWKSALFLCVGGEHEDLRAPLVESIRRVTAVPSDGWDSQSVDAFFGPAWLYRQTGEAGLLDPVRRVLDRVIAGRPRTMGVLTDAGFVDDPLGVRGGRAGWCDAAARSLVWPELLHAYGGSMAAMTRATGDRRYQDEAMRLVRHLAERHLEADGIVNHGTRDGARIGQKWTRAQSHMLYGLLHIFEEMEPGDPEAGRIVELIRRIGSGLRQYQDHETGLWRNLLDHPQARLESTGTACFTYVFARGIRDGWLEAGEFGRMVRRGREGLKLCYWRNGFAACCRGSRVGADALYYLARPQGWTVLPQGLMAMVASQGIE